MSRRRVTFTYEVRADVDLTSEECVEAVHAALREWRRSPRSTTTVHRHVDRPKEWDDKVDGPWLESEAFKKTQPLTEVMDAGTFVSQVAT